MGAGVHLHRVISQTLFGTIIQNGRNVARSDTSRWQGIIQYQILLCGKCAMQLVYITKLVSTLYIRHGFHLPMNLLGRPNDNFLASCHSLHRYILCFTQRNLLIATLHFSELPDIHCTSIYALTLHQPCIACTTQGAHRQP